MLTVPILTTAALPSTGAILALGPLTLLALLGVAGTLAALAAGAITEAERPHDDAVRPLSDLRHAV